MTDCAADPSREPPPARGDDGMDQSDEDPPKCAPDEDPPKSSETSEKAKASSETKLNVDEDEKVRIRREKKRESVRRSRKRQRDYVLQIEGENQRLKEELQKLRQKYEQADNSDVQQPMPFQTMPRHVAPGFAPKGSASMPPYGMSPLPFGNHPQQHRASSSTGVAIQPHSHSTASMAAPAAGLPPMPPSMHSTASISTAMPSHDYPQSFNGGSLPQYQVPAIHASGSANAPINSGDFSRSGDPCNFLMDDWFESSATEGENINSSSGAIGERSEDMLKEEVTPLPVVSKEESSRLQEIRITSIKQATHDINKHGLDSEVFYRHFYQTFHPQCTLISPDLNMEIKGRDKAIKYTTSIGRAFPDMTITNTVFERDEAEIDVVKMKFDMLGTHVHPIFGISPSGKKIRANCRAVLKYEPHTLQIVHQMWNWDMSKVLLSLLDIPAVHSTK